MERTCGSDFIINHDSSSQIIWSWIKKFDSSSELFSSLLRLIDFWERALNVGLLGSFFLSFFFSIIFVTFASYGFLRKSSKCCSFRLILLMILNGIQFITIIFVRTIYSSTYKHETHMLIQCCWYNRKKIFTLEIKLYIVQQIWNNDTAAWPHTYYSRNDKTFLNISKLVFIIRFCMTLSWSS